MNTTALARILNERRLRASPVVTTGELITSIGSEGMQEALAKQWLVPDHETGYLMVNLNGGKIAEIGEACKCGTCGKPDCKCESANSLVDSSTAMPNHMREAWAGAGIGRGSDNMSGGNTVMPRPAPISPTTTPAPAKPGVTDPVMVVDDNGESVVGAVSDVEQDGRLRVKFGDHKPRMDRPYNPSELRPVQPNA